VLSGKQFSVCPTALLLIENINSIGFIFTGKEKKPEVGEKRVYRISRKFFGFVVFLSDKNLEKKSSIYTKTT
jgi:hypothetical protein